MIAFEPAPPPSNVPDRATLRRIAWQLKHLDWTVQGPQTATGNGRWVALHRAPDADLPELEAGATLSELMDALEARDALDDLGGDAA